MFFYLMHIIHVLTVILWIGGLAFVTMIVLPMAIKTPDALSKVLMFQRVEHRFANIARIYNIVTGVTGFAMLFMSGMHKALFTSAAIPLTVMTVIWIGWFVMLFGLEPVIIRKMLNRMAARDPNLDIDSIFIKLNRLHWVLVVLSLVAAAAGVMTAHGLSLY